MSAQLADNNHSAPSARFELLWLITAAFLTILLWQLPLGNYILYPFTLLATWFHEMGHGFTAALLGGKFHRLLIFPDGSGLAMHSGVVAFGPLGRALVSAGGPLGPPIAGALFIFAGRRYQLAHYTLFIFGSILIVSALLWVRSGFGLLIISLMGVLILLLAWKAKPWAQGFAIQFLGVQACISTWQQVNYLFTYSVEIDGKQIVSDTGQIAGQLFLPYWFWGVAITLFSLVILAFSLWRAYRSED